MRSCHNICILHEPVKISKFIYETKDVCRVCNCGFEKGIFKSCPCCKHNLSTKPRNSKLKTKYLSFFNKPNKPRNSIQKRNTLPTVQQWNCIGYAGIQCSVLLNNIRSSKPKLRCENCQREFKLERMRSYHRNKKLERFLRGNVS